MLAYTAGRPNAVRKESSPHAFLIIVAAHVAALAAVMSARMDLPPRFRERPTIVDLINNPPVTPPPAHQRTKPIERQTVLPTEDREVILPPLPDDSNLVTEDHGSNVVINGGGSGTGTAQELTPSAAVPTHHDARLLTPPPELKPPYPAAKLLTEEEATLTLRLSIDSSGRVVAVEPVGRADRVFVDAARRHLLAHWRYQPATDGDRAVPSSVTITLRFMLDA
jgi:protein TonB